MRHNALALAQSEVTNGRWLGMAQGVTMGVDVLGAVLGVMNYKH